MSSLFRYCFLIILFLNIQVFWSFLPAQPSFTSKTFTTSDGLVYNTVTSICQDTTGFLWVGTWYGLSRFDGYEFKNYYFSAYDSVSLPYFSIDKVVSDRKNNLFVFCFNLPVGIYNRVADRFEPLLIKGMRKDIECSDIQTDNSDRIWIAGDDMIFRSSDSGKNFIKIAVINEMDQPVTSVRKPMIAIDNKGAVWLYTAQNGSLTFYRGKIENDTIIKINQQKTALAGNFYENDFYRNNMIRIYESENGKIWLFSENGLYLLDNKTNQFREFASVKDCSDLGGNTSFIWVDKDSGINIYDPVSSELKTTGRQLDYTYSSVFISKDSIVWAASSGSNPDAAGLARFMEVPRYFRHYLTGKNEKGEPYLVFPVLKDKYGDLWAGARNSKYLFHIKPDGKIIKEKYLDSYKGQKYPLVKSLAEDENGIWIGCTQNHLICHDFKSAAFKTLLNAPYNYQDRQTPLEIHNILNYGESLLISGWLGIYLFNKKTNELNFVTRYHPFGNGFTIERERNGDFLVGSHTATVVHFDNKLFRDEISFGNRRELVTGIADGDSNDFWVALQGAGLGHMNKITKKYEIYSIAHGLANNNVYSILKDRKGMLWLSSDKGISSFNPETKQFRNYSSEDGLFITEFNDDSKFLDKDGTMYFGGIGGFVGFDPDKIEQENKIKYPILFTALSVSGKPVRLNKPVYESDSISLGKGDNNLMASIACLDLGNGNSVKYRYRLLGLSEKWIETNQRNRNILYYNLKPAKYRLEAEAAGIDGRWSSSASLVIIVPPSIIQTLWFRVAVLISLLVIISGIVLSYISHIRLRARQESDELRLEALRARMNPHFIFNSLNSINYYILNNDKLSANHYISDFARLMRAFLNNLSGDFIQLDSEIQMIKDYLDLEKMRFHEKFTFSVTVLAGTDISKFYLFPGIVQPLVENAVLHGISALDGREGNISVLFENEGDSVIKCIIEDNGIGRKCSEQYKNPGYGRNARGTDIVRERLKLYNRYKKTNYRLETEDLYSCAEATGTRVILYIPARMV